jgi:hypothetical protein
MRIDFIWLESIIEIIAQPKNHCSFPHRRPIGQTTLKNLFQKVKNVE